ncbi:LysE family translocator [Roseinatronobacter alkalisoli]|uniref:LysE family translocator n=1 Tax=Roseinatronobacter alkalisoli TaxID=3028235 RepID=A0ABT5TEU0_9RHOB|nr:LysE family translocator [Roseinatronobacter sp. HJB301]MDD7973629.1 LysE family translocator [Roseinatronobacter sp. HJB301]
MVLFGISFVALAIYYWTMSITPGPNNVMLTVSGANFGFNRTIPHITGIGLGCSVQTFLLCLGLGAIFTLYPVIQEVLKWVGAAYLIYLSVKLIGAKVKNATVPQKPLTMMEAALFQFINPKAWVKATTTATIFLPAGTSPIGAGIAIFTVCLAVNVVSASTWATFGVGIGRFLSNSRGLMIFNYSMAALLIGTAGYVVAV